MKKFRHSLLSLVLLKLLVVVVVLPRRVSLFLGGLIGVWTSHLAKSYRVRTEKNISGAFPELKPTEIRNLRIKVFKNAGMNLVEFAIFSFRSEKFWRKRVEISGEEILKENAGRKGIIYLTAHTGNWELMGAFLSMAGYSINVVAKEMKNSFQNSLLVGIRDLMGVKTIYRDGRSNTKKMITALKRKEVLGILIDQDTEVGGVFADFFNGPAYTPTACSQFARIKNTLVIPGFIYRKSNLRHEIVIMEPVEGGKDQLAETARYNKIIEGFVREHPADWVWMHRRWKRSPA
ncbi:MAG: lysophospholipid acyltransferase family protein [Elusimicrobia bacterium]|nr:lysophospholipid acyltransferase family protein [Elusimicrobiota bacterium]